MGIAAQVVSGRVTNPGATITAVTMDTGDSNTVRNANPGIPIRLLSAWAMGATAGVVRLRSPLLHDAVQGIRLRFSANNPDPLLPEYIGQLLMPQDVLTIEQSGGGAETDMLSLLVEYDDLPGASAQLSTWDAIRDQIEYVAGVECNLTTGATAGQYGDSQALNANFDLLKRNRYYAVLGYLTDTAFGTLGLTGADFGNLRVGGPGSTRNELTSGWFVDLAVRENAPRIPVFNSANVAGVTVDVATPATATAINVTFICALLKSYQPV